MIILGSTQLWNIVVLESIILLWMKNVTVDGLSYVFVPGGCVCLNSNNSTKCAMKIGLRNGILIGGPGEIYL